MDLAARPRPCRRMDQDTDNLVAQICSRAGIIMEDAAHSALTMRAVAGPDRSEALSKLCLAAQQISVLLNAAQVLQNISKRAGATL